MRKAEKSPKQHFELSPANSRRLDEYLERYNGDPNRVTPRLKIGDVVNRAMDEWFARRPFAGEGGSDDA
jgi:hypothetical protein